MSISSPRLHFSDAEKRILWLLGDAISQYKQEADRLFVNPLSLNNTPNLGNEVAAELFDLLKELTSNAEFQKSAYFVDNILAQNAELSDNLREIFLSERKKHGRTRALATKQWQDFNRRLGNRKHELDFGTSQQMNHTYFMKMERKLFIECQIRPDIIELILDFIRPISSEVISKHYRERYSNVDSLKNFASILTRLDDLQRHGASNLKVQHLISLTVFTSNAGALFTTRDWSVAGTISCMSGSIVGVFA